MPTDKDDVIRRIVEKGQREGRASSRSARKGASTTRVSRPIAKNADGQAGKNGRQVVEPKGVKKGAVKPATRTKSVATQTQSVDIAPSKTESSKSKESKPKVESEIHIWIALVLFFVAGYLFLSTLSYLIYWEPDADISQFSNFFNVKLEAARNWGGKFGAVVADLIIGQWVGVMGVMVPVVFLMLGLRLLRIPSLRLKKTIIASIALMFIGSLALGHFFGRNVAVFGSGWGGESGIYISEWLSSVIGYEGTSLLVVFVALALLYYANSSILTSIGALFKSYLARRDERRIAARERERLHLQKADEAEVLQRQNVEQEIQGQLADIKEDNQPNVGGVVQSQEQMIEPVVPHEQSDESKEQIVVPQSENYEHNRVQEVDKTQLIELEGAQWGYIIDYDVAGNPVYLYVDTATLVSNVAEVQSGEKVVKAHKFVEAPPKEELQNEDDIEFVVYEAPIEPKVERVAESVVGEQIEMNVEPEPVYVGEPNVKIEDKVEEPKNLDFAVESAKEEEKLSAVDINTMPLYDPTAELPNYRKPMVELLKEHTNKVVVTKEELNANKDRIIHTLLTFGIKIDSIKATVGPTVTLYEIIPAPGVRISKIKNLEDDIALTLSALGIRIIAPIPGKGTIGIEVPNQNKEIVSMHSVVCSAKFQDIKAELPIALGKNIQGETFAFDLAKMPHLLVAGATGQGKSVGLNAIITSLLYKKHPSELKFVLVDPKKVELTLYSQLEKHFLAKMEGEEEAIITDTQKVVYTLNSICKEMDERYDLLKKAMVRNIVEYNDKFIHRRLNPEKGHRFLPYFVVVIDEFADLIMTAGREVETPIARIAQLARAVGIHLIIATQRPTTNIITGVIKANFPARIAFRVTSMIDSRTILDTPGANQLIGKGDMLVSTGSEMTRVQCAFVDTPEVADIVEFIASQRGYVSAYELPEFVPESDNGSVKDVDMTKKDALFEEVARFVVGTQTGSASTIQRKFSIGFNRAGRLIDQLEAAGIVGRQVGSKPREVLIQDPVTLEMIING